MPNEVVDSTPSQPSPVGLLASAIVINETTTRWEQGLSFIPEMCAVDGMVFDPCDADPGKLAQPIEEYVSYTPFGILQGVSCSTFSPGVDVEADARRALNVSRERLISGEFWTGTLVRAATPDLTNPYLASGTAVTQPNTTTATTPVRALAQLETGISLCHAGRSMIHARRDTVTYWAAAGLLRREGNLLLTINDTIVVPGEGYTGSAPSTPDTVPGAPSAWAYATPLVTVRLGSVVNLAPAAPEVTTENLRTAFAEQFVAVTFDPCCIVGINVSHVPDTTPAA